MNEFWHGTRLAAADRLREFYREQFIGRVAEFLADVNALHPFREGNGRAQRAFFSQLAHDAGHHIDWVRMDPTATPPPAQPDITATSHRSPRSRAARRLEGSSDPASCWIA
jgi:fido (protein-threonine AMPylation protein)